MAADDYVSVTYINGNFVLGARTDTATSYTDFSITSGSVSGVNTLEFVVFGGADGPIMGLRVDSLTGTASPLGQQGPVPEPGTMVLLATACLGTIALNARSKKAA
jgi:hypothetical protein